MYIKPERYNPPRGNDGYHLTKSKTNIKGGTIIKTDIPFLYIYESLHHIDWRYRCIFTF